MLRIIMISFLISFNAFAVTYSQFQVENVVSSQSNDSATKNFANEFFTSKQPQDFIRNIIDSDKSKLDPIVIEYKLYSLLSEISFRSQQEYLSDFVQLMKNYESKAFKIHEEGRVPVPVFEIAAKAQGIENIWSAAASFNDYSRLFDQDSISTVEQLNNEMNYLSNPEWHGLKKSVDTITSENHNLITQYLIKNISNLGGLDKFISHYALKTKNKELIELGLLHLNKSQSEYILRNIKLNFSEEFVVGQLIYLVNKGKHQAFTISMMRSYLENPKIQGALLKYMNDEKTVKEAALVLAKSENIHVLNELKSIYQTNDSEMIKKQIVYSLKMNQKNEAKIILKQLHKTSDTNNWLKSFDGRGR